MNFEIKQHGDKALILECKTAQEANTAEQNGYRFEQWSEKIQAYIMVRRKR